MEKAAVMGGAATASLGTPGPSVPQMPLSFARRGEEVTIVKVRSKGDMVRHLETLGFVEGAKVKVINDVTGDLVIELKGSQLAVGRDVASRIVCA